MAKFSVVDATGAAGVTPAVFFPLPFPAFSSATATSVTYILPSALKVVLSGTDLETEEGVITDVELQTADGEIIAAFRWVSVGNEVTRSAFEAAWETGSTDAFTLLLAGDDFITGAEGHDLLLGGDGNDAITGAGGMNTLIGGAGDDDILGGSFENYIEPGAGNDFIDGGGNAVDAWGELWYRTGATTGITVEFDAFGRSGTVSNDGQGGQDTFTRIDAVRGTDFEDTFIGGSGGSVQRFMGFAGNDTFDGSLGLNEVDYRHEARAIDAVAGMTIDLSGDGPITVIDPTGDTDTLIGIERVRGTDNDDTIIGNDLNNRLRGDGGNDTLEGGEGDDRLEGGAANDSILGGDGHDNLFGDAGDDTLDGGSGINNLYGGDGNDRILGGLHENYIEGGAGDDTIVGAVGNDDTFTQLGYWGATAGIIATFSTARDGQVSDGQGGTDIFINVHAIGGTQFNDQFVGEGPAEGPSQRFIGFAGNDTFDGTNGVNEVDYRSDARAAGRTTGMIIDISEDLDVHVLDALGHTDRLISIERVRGTDYNDTIIGNSLDNRLRGDSGNDRLNGGGGNDRLEGGNGDDFIDGSTGDDTIYGGNIDGTDSVDSFNEINYRDRGFTAVTVEFGNTAGSGTVTKSDGSKDTFSGINSVHGTNSADTFKGGTNNLPQRFIGHGGNDSFDGTLGVNEIDYRTEARVAGRTTGMTIDLSAGSQVTVQDATGATDTLIAIERIRGTDYGDRIVGSNLNNRLRGDGGNDTLKGGAGNDRIEGGSSSDTAEFSGSRSDYAVVLNGDGTLNFTDQQAGRDGQDTVLEVEYFRFGSTLLSLAEVLNNGTGISLANGMVLENSGVGQSVGTLSVLNPDAGSQHTFELLDSAGGRFRMGADGKTLEVANGILLDFEQSQFHSVTVRARDQSGKTIDATLTVALLDQASETTTGTDGSDTVSGGAGADEISGGNGNDILAAGAGKDVLNGGNGNDRLVGGAGLDKLTGGKGKDVFAFGNKDTGTSKKTADYITDFRPKEKDRLDLKAIDADTKKKGDQSFSFIGKNDFSKAGQVRYEKTSTETYVYLNTDSDKAAEGVIRLKGSLDLQKGWFIL
jgi:Ca2+-binding RTX toxin-like protein